MADCIKCEEEYSDKRQELGYDTCLECGQLDATRIIRARNKEKLAEIAPRAAAGVVVTNEEPDWDHEFQRPDEGESGEEQ